MLTFFQKESVLRGLTTDAGIREASRVIFPAVLVTQGMFLTRTNYMHFPCRLMINTCAITNSPVLKGLAYPVNGIIMGGLDWKFTMAVRSFLELFFFSIFTVH